MSRVFSKIKQILHKSYSIQLDQIQLETNIFNKLRCFKPFALLHFTNDKLDDYNSDQ